mgnify:CR=1 FL=1
MADTSCSFWNRFDWLINLVKVLRDLVKTITKKAVFTIFLTIKFSKSFSLLLNSKKFSKSFSKSRLQKLSIVKSCGMFVIYVFNVVLGTLVDIQYVFISVLFSVEPIQEHICVNLQMYISCKT